MKQYIGTMKVGDLLHTIGATDAVSFQDKYVHELDSIVAPGISGELYLQALNSTSILLTIKSLTCTIRDISDISGNEYERPVSIKDYQILCALPVTTGSIEDIYESFEDIYEIDHHNLTVDLETCIINAIKSQEPIVKKKNDENLGEGGIEVVDIPPL